MILYTKTFPLGKGISFPHYIDSLDKKNFSPFTLLINRIPNTKKVLVEVVLTDVAVPLAMSNTGFVIGGVLFNEITIEYSERRNFILQASISMGNIINVLFYIVLSAFLLFFILFAIAINNMSLQNSVVVLLVLALVLYPFISTYLREIKFLDKIGSLGSEMDEK